MQTDGNDAPALTLGRRYPDEGGPILVVRAGGGRKKPENRICARTACRLSYAAT